MGYNIRKGRDIEALYVHVIVNRLRCISYVVSGDAYGDLCLKLNSLVWSGVSIYEARVSVE